MKKTTVLIVAMLLLITTSCTQQTNLGNMDYLEYRDFVYESIINLAVNNKQKPEICVVNDEATAIKIGEMYFDLFFDKEDTRKETESEAIYNKEHDVWLVLKKHEENTLGISPVIVFNKHGAQVLYMGLQ